MFTSTKPGTREDLKAHFKNHNLPILQHMYMGSPTVPLSCTVNSTPAFCNWPCVVQNKPMVRFLIEFNHIRQLATDKRQAGTSVDKSTGHDPSHLMRSRALDNPKHQADLVEFMTMMPVDANAHKWITQSSAYGNIVLTNFDYKNWPWHLKSSHNFKSFTSHYGLGSLDYHQFIDHLSNINHPPIRQRLKQTDQGPVLLDPPVSGEHRVSTSQIASNPELHQNTSCIDLHPDPFSASDRISTVD